MSSFIAGGGAAGHAAAECAAPLENPHARRAHIQSLRRQGRLKLIIIFIECRSYFPSGLQGAKHNLKNDMILMIIALSET